MVHNNVIVWDIWLRQRSATSVTGDLMSDTAHFVLMQGGGPTNYDCTRAVEYWASSLAAAFISPSDTKCFLQSVPGERLRRLPQQHPTATPVQTSTPTPTLTPRLQQRRFLNAPFLILLVSRIKSLVPVNF